MKFEIYQVGKLPPLTVVESDSWELVFDNVPRIKFYNIEEHSRPIVAEFILSNIAGFKKVGADNG